jgi:hypothetical protein
MGASSSPLLLLVAIPALVMMVVWYWPMFSVEPSSTQATLSKVDTFLWSRLATVRERDYTYTSGDEFRPIACLHPLELTRRGDVSLIEAPEQAGTHVAVTPLPGDTLYHLAFTIDADELTLLAIHQMYLPGWVVSIDGKDVSRETLESWLATDGRMRVWVPKGRCELRATYDGPGGWRVRNGIILAVLAGAAGVMVVDRRRV